MQQANKVGITPDFLKLIGKTKAFLATPEAKEQLKTPGSAPTRESLTEERTIPDHKLHVDINQLQEKYGGHGGGFTSADRNDIEALLTGKIKMGQQIKPASTQAAKPASADPLSEVNRLMENLTPQAPRPTAAPIAEKREILTEVVSSLKKGGLLKEEIMRIVLEEALTEKTLVPLLQKHFDKLMTNFIASRKKS
jgi:hypothetical protein